MMKKTILKIFAALLLCVACAAQTVTLSAAATVETGLAAAEPAVKPVAGGLELSAPADARDAVRFVVYSITGQAVKSVEVSAGSPVTVELPAGVYIVRCNRWSHRYIVR